ncbi:MAG: hypothetical protein AMJ93_02625 [Anaerolineae bacterium SM23_84]|nr:MAG: hypothetical protein AMJ93_02625 [Anaerolineae bacterium SM23_84]
MDTETLIMLAPALLVAGYLSGGGLWASGLQAGATSRWRPLPVLLISFAVIGSMQVVLPGEQLMRWLGSEAGLRGIATGCLVGALVAGPPYAMYPVVASLYHGGASIRALVDLMIGKALWDVHHLPSDIAVLGLRITLVRSVSSLLV